MAAIVQGETRIAAIVAELTIPTTAVFDAQLTIATVLGAELTLTMPAILRAKLAIVVAAVLDPNRLAMVAVCPLRLGAVAVVATLGLEVCETLTAAALDPLRLAAATPLDVSSPLLATTAALHALGFRAATTLCDRTLSAATALHLSLTLTAATLGARLALAATALCLGLRLAAALDLRMAAVATLFRFRRSWGGNRHRRDTCCQDELPHLHSPIPRRVNGPVTDPFHLLRDMEPV